MEKYKNKFEEIVENAKTNINEISDSNDDVEMVTQMSSELTTMNIGEDFSNSQQIKLQMPLETYNSKNKVIDSLDVSDRGDEVVDRTKNNHNGPAFASTHLIDR